MMISVDLKDVEIILRAYASAQGASMSSIIRSCVREKLSDDLRRNAGLRERYTKARAELISKAGNNVVRLHR